MQAHAVVAVERGRVEFQTVTVPEPGREDVVVRLTHSWISNGTEGSFVRGERIGGDTPRAETDPLPFPHVPGYQKVGIVERIGADVSHVAVGDTVFATVSAVEGMFYPSGGHVSPAVTHKSQVWKLPPGVDPVAASGLVLTQVGYNVGQCSALKPGDAAVVIGDGMVGQWAAQTLQHRGARVMMVGKHAERLRLFKASPDDRCVKIQETNVVEAVREWAGRSVQVVADTVGSLPTVLSLFPLMRRFSQFVSAGFYGHSGQIDVQKMRDYEMTLWTPAGWTGERMDRTLELLQQGVLQTLPLITHHFPVSQAAEAFDLILSRREPVLGVILDWEGIQ
ncbi:MAG: tdh 2 [Chthonomonadaceae bacterium]|nr:tdh 2 [Chthonomonadaceae bacterium]